MSLKVRSNSGVDLETAFFVVACLINKHKGLDNVNRDQFYLYKRNHYHIKVKIKQSGDKVFIVDHS